MPDSVRAAAAVVTFLGAVWIVAAGLLVVAAFATADGVPDDTGASTVDLGAALGFALGAFFAGLGQLAVGLGTWRGSARARATAIVYCIVFAVVLAMASVFSLLPGGLSVVSAVTWLAIAAYVAAAAALITRWPKRPEAPATRS